MGSGCWVPPLWEVKVQAPVDLLAAFPRGQRLLSASPVGGEGAGPCGPLGRSYVPAGRFLPCPEWRQLHLGGRCVLAGRLGPSF